MNCADVEHVHLDAGLLISAVQKEAIPSQRPVVLLSLCWGVIIALLLRDDEVCLGAGWEWEVFDHIAMMLAEIDTTPDSKDAKVKPGVRHNDIVTSDLG
jgi:hypothetical protein